MYKFKPFLCALLITTTAISSTMVNRVKAYNLKDKLSTNPYVQAYLNEKNNKSTQTNKNQSNDYLVDPQVEENIIIATLEEYYNQDIEVANVLKKHVKKSDLEKNVLAPEKNGKICTMKNIKEIFSNVTDVEEKKILLGYLKRYARSTKDDTSMEFLDKHQQTFPSINVDRNDAEKQGGVVEGNPNVTSNLTMSISSYTGSYYGGSAAQWAYNNYSSYSTSYPAFNNNYGSDCTNFVSQAMHTGGSMPMQGNWYCYMKNPVYLRPSSIYELNYSWSLSDPSPWISVKTFEDFWSDRVNYKFYAVDTYRTQHSTIYSGPIYRGDVVIFWQGVAGFASIPTHAMIISAYDSVNRDFLLAGHSRERQAYPLLSAISSYAEIEFIEF